jgi:hypothetical protein
MRHTKVCSKPGCPNIAPCSEHTRDPNQPRDRHRTSEYMRDHNRLRRQLIKQGRGEVCERCGLAGTTQMHHVRADNHPGSVQFLCSACHREVDHWAR